MQRPEQVGGHNHSGPLTANWGGEVLNMPNAITFGRLCAVPVAVWFVLQGQMGWALVLFVLAGVSDGVVGWLARRRGGTVLGAWMDPAADKALLVGMFVALASMGLLPAWLAVLVVLRDLVIIGGIAAMWWLAQPIHIRPMLLGKANTVLQILLVGVVLFLESQGLHAPALRAGLIAGAAAATVVSGALYVRGAMRETG